jgi:hypothetical protein
MASTGILRPADVFSVATRRSSSANERRAAKILEAAANQTGMVSPFEVTPRPSNMLLIILFNHVKMDSTDGTQILGNDFMGASSQGLQRVYDKAGHKGSWTAFRMRPQTGTPRVTISTSTSSESSLVQAGRIWAYYLPCNKTSGGTRDESRQAALHGTRMDPGQKSAKCAAGP